MVFLYTVSKTSSCSQRYTVLPDEEVVQSFLYLQELQSEHLYFRYFMPFFDVFSKNASLYPPGHVYSSVLVFLFPNRGLTAPGMPHSRRRPGKRTVPPLPLNPPLRPA